MGGLVARTMPLEKPDTWQRMMARDGARLLMLGTPNGGSWAPMQTLSGDDTFGNALAAFGSLFDNGGARKMMAGMPGFLQLQAALLDPALGLDRAETWQKLADDDMARLRDAQHLARRAVQRDDLRMGRAAAGGARPGGRAAPPARRASGRLGADAAKMLLVVGHAPFTPAGIVLGDNGLEYIDAVDGGDGRVPLVERAAARRAHLEARCRARRAAGCRDGVRRPTSSCSSAARRALLDRLRAARPRRARRVRAGAARATADAAASVARSRPSRGLHRRSRRRRRADVLGGDARRPATAARAAASRALHVSVLNGDLKFVHQPLLVGHYRSIDADRHRRRRRPPRRQGDEPLARRRRSIPTRVGIAPDLRQRRARTRTTCWRWRARSPCVVAGLGEEGKLRAVDLVYTVRQAVIAYAQRLAESEAGAPAEFELAATLIGSGGTGISAGSSAQLIAQGASEANQKLQDNGWPQVGQLILVELYLDRASDAWRALQLQAHGGAEPAQGGRHGQVGRGRAAPLARFELSRRRLRLHQRRRPAAGNGGAPTIAYTLDTKRARTEVRAQQTQATLAARARRQGVERRQPRSADRPHAVQPARAGRDGAVPRRHQRDGDRARRRHRGLPVGTARHLVGRDPGGDPRPWAIRSKLLRKLRTASSAPRCPTPTPTAASSSSASRCSTRRCTRRCRARAPRRSRSPTRLTGGPAGVDAARVRALTSGNDDARTIINALFERPYRIVHIAGHGAPGPDGGVVLSGGTFLGAAEVKAMRTVPELVFLNCCHLAARDAKTVLAPYDRAEFAANIAEALIEIGVRCVIAAGWAVEDGPAEIFATTFYDVLLGGGRFIDAVAAARSRRLAGRAPAATPGRPTSAMAIPAGPGGATAATRSAPPPRAERRVRRRRRRRPRSRSRSRRSRSACASAATIRSAAKASSRRSATRSAFSKRSSRRSGARWARSPRPSAWPGPTPVTRQGDRLVPRSPSMPRTAARRSGPPSSSATCWRGAAKSAPIRPGRAARHRRGNRAPAAAGRDPADHRARIAARLGLQAPDDGRGARRGARRPTPRGRKQRVAPGGPPPPPPPPLLLRAMVLTTATPSGWRARRTPPTSSTRPRTASAPSCVSRFSSAGRPKSRSTA